MMAPPRRYYDILCGLPALSPPFLENRPPLSRIALERALKPLHPDDAKQLDLLESVMFFTALPRDLDDADVIARADAVLVALESRMLRSLAEWRLSLRTALVALRRRRSGEGPPPPDTPWGVGPWRRIIARNWQRPDLGLSALVPWLEDGARLLDDDEPRALERLLIEKVWDRLSDAAFLCHFDFDAIALYVLRWDTIHRATRHNSARAQTRFEAMLDASLPEAERYE